MHTVNLTKHHNDPWKLILKHAICLAQVIKLHDVDLYNITPYKKCTVLESTYAQ